MQMIMNKAIAPDELYRLKFNPPLVTGFVSRSPSVAPKGLVRINAVQNKYVCDAFVKKYASATSAIAPAKISAPPSYPGPNRQPNRPAQSPAYSRRGWSPSKTPPLSDP